MLVWTLVVGFAVGGEARSIAGYRRAYEAATNQTLVPSSFYDRFAAESATLLRDLLKDDGQQTLFTATDGGNSRTPNTDSVQ